MLFPAWASQCREVDRGLVPDTEMCVTLGASLNSAGLPMLCL